MEPPGDLAPGADPAAAFTAATTDLLAAWQQADPAVRRSVALELRQQLAALASDLGTAAQASDSKSPGAVGASLRHQRNRS